MDTKKEAKEFGLKVGDILSAGWGYEAEIYDFYEVVGITRTMIKVRELKKTRAEGESSYPMYYGVLVKPVTEGADRFIGDVITRKPYNYYQNQAKEHTFIAITSYKYAYLWNGEPCDQYNAH